MKTEFLITKSFTFEAAHQLKFHDGKCRRLHGHSFKLTIVLQGDNVQNDRITTITDFQPDSVSIVNPEADIPSYGISGTVKSSFDEPNPKANMLIDYGQISMIVKPFLEDKLDHQFLNETLQTDSPTSEYIASFCFGYFSRAFREIGANLVEVRISETCTSEAIYRVKPTFDYSEFAQLIDQKISKI